VCWRSIPAIMLCTQAAGFSAQPRNLERNTLYYQQSVLLVRHAGVLSCGLVGMGAGLSHSPVDEVRTCRWLAGCHLVAAEEWLAREDHQSVFAAQARS